MICNKCGTNVNHDAGYCPKCGQVIKRSAGRTDKRLLEAVLPWEEKPLLGILGALGSAVIGGLVMFQMLQFSSAYWVSTLGGAILTVCTMGGYWKLGGRLSTLGKILSILLVAFTGWLVDWVIWSYWYLFSSSQILSLWDAFVRFPDYLYNNPSVNAEYIFGLLFLYEGCVIAMAIILVLHKRVSKV